MTRLLATVTILAAIIGLSLPAAAQLRANPTGPGAMGTGSIPAPALMTPPPAAPANPPLNAVGAPPLGAVGAPPVGAIGNTPTGAITPPAGGMIGGTMPNPTGPSQLATPGPGPAIDLNQFDNRLH